MRLPILGVLLLVLGTAHADYVARQGSDYVRLTDAPCHESVPIPAEQRERFLGAFAQIGGKQYRACWALRQDGVVVVQYSDGDAGLIHSSNFKPEQGV